MRRLNDWEEESVCNLLAILASREVRDQVKDELVWPLDVKGSFNIKSFCNAVFISLSVLVSRRQLSGGRKLLQKSFFLPRLSP